MTHQVPPEDEDWLTKDKLFEALKDLPGNTHMEIHVQECSCQQQADYEIKIIGRVSGTPDDEPWFTLEVGEFICNCLWTPMSLSTDLPGPCSSTG